jgi:PKD repeat protein
MKRIFSLMAALAALALGTNVHAVTPITSFTAGDVVILRVGAGGSELLTNTGNTVWLDEFNQSGGYVGSMMIPTNQYGANAPLVLSGSDYSEGMMTLSQDGRFLIVPGFGASPGQFTNDTLYFDYATNQVPRVVGIIDGQGNINTMTVQTNALLNTAEMRGAASTDGTNFWFTTDSAGIYWTTMGSTIATQIYKTSSAMRGMFVCSNQLYLTSAGDKIAASTNVALPETTSGLFQTLPKVLAACSNSECLTNGSPFGLAMFNLNGGPTPDTLYVTDGSISVNDCSSTGSSGGLWKYCLNAGTWTLAGSGPMCVPDAYAVTGVQNGQNVTLFVTEGGTTTGNAISKLYIGTDTSGFNGDPSGTTFALHYGDTEMGLGSGSINFRGIAMAPNGNQPLTNAANTAVSVGPIYAPTQIGGYGGPFSPGTFTFSVANFTASTLSGINVQFPGGSAWLQQYNTLPSTLAPYASTNAVITNNTAAYTKNPGSYAGNVVFNPGGVGRVATIEILAFSLTPSTNWISSGPVGGPFVPSSQLYVLKNIANSGTLNWVGYTAQPWSSLSATTGGLAAAASQNITYTINSASAPSTPGIYYDSIIISNVTANPNILQFSVQVTLAVGFGIFDDYSASGPYTQGANLVGQNGWAALDNAGVNSYQVYNGVLNILEPSPPYTPCDNGEEDVKNMTLTAVKTNTAKYVYAGMSITVSNAVSGSPPWSGTMEVGTAIDNPTYEHNAMAPVASGGGYVWYCRTATDTSWVPGSTVRNYGVQYQVIVAGDLSGTNTWIFVNPAASSTNYAAGQNDHINLYTMSADTHDGAGDGEDAQDGVGGWMWGQYGETVCQAAFTVSKLAVSTNYASVYAWLNPPPACSAPTAAFTTTPTPASGPAPLAVQFNDGSSAGSGSLTTWVWTFGDPGNNTSATESPSFTYSAPGTYTASLSVTNSCGKGSASPAMATVTVYDPFAWWESHVYSLSGSLTGGNASYTGDGMSNTNKFEAGFSPVNAAAYLHIISVSKAVASGATNVTVTYLGANGDSTAGVGSRTNILEYSTGSGNGSYNGTFQVAPGSGSTNIFSGGAGLGLTASMTDSNVPAVNDRYYRVRVLLP